MHFSLSSGEMYISNKYVTCDFFSQFEWPLRFMTKWIKLNSSSCLKGKVQSFKPQNSAYVLVRVQDRNFTMSPVGDIIDYNLSYLWWEVFQLKKKWVKLHRVLQANNLLEFVKVLKHTHRKRCPHSQFYLYSLLCTAICWSENYKVKTLELKENINDTNIHSRLKRLCFPVILSYMIG